MKIKTSELTGAALDWVVAKLETKETSSVVDLYKLVDGLWVQHYKHQYSTDWSQGGPIIERENIDTRKTYNSGVPSTNPYDAWKAQMTFKNGKLVAGEFFDYGQTPLIAGLRCYVASELGDEVDIPEELI